jgi:glyoxylase-like metal-dependent hydrolase (beta-lactamase superfamily II)
MPPFYVRPEAPDGIERELVEGQEWIDAGFRYQVIHTPGHTPGGVCFLFPEEAWLISGDTLFQGSIGRTDLPGGDMRVLQQSLARLLQLPDSLRVFPGHGPPTTIGVERRTNPFLLDL